ncbi:MAG: peptide-methionine (S)-S-oxide reductase [Porticoccus sp.]|jgi:peptide-methionine (S)-S-oxide reductase
MFENHSKAQMIDSQAALPGRSTLMMVNNRHYVSDAPIVPPFPDGMAQVVFSLGCFWGAERLFWVKEGVYTTAVGYAGGYTENPTYEEVCSGLTGHTEAVLVVYDPSILSLQELLKVFWEAHDPTQGMRQGNDQGTQYRSAIYCQDSIQLSLATQSRDSYQKELERTGHQSITTEIANDKAFFYAEGCHQQYLEKNPGGYCGLGGTGVTCPE